MLEPIFVPTNVAAPLEPRTQHPSPHSLAHLTRTGALIPATPTHPQGSHSRPCHARSHRRKPTPLPLGLGVLQDASLRVSSRRASHEIVPHSPHRRDGSPPATAVPPPESLARSISLGASTSMTPSTSLGHSKTCLLKDSPRGASPGSLSSAATVPGVGVFGWSGGGRGGGGGDRKVSRDGGSAPLTF